MNRRHLLSRGGTVAALALAGCSVLGSGESTPTAESLQVSALDYHAADDGSLVVTVTVSNTASEPVSGTLYVDLTANGSAHTRVRTVTVEAAGTTDVVAEFDDVTVEEFEQHGSLSTRWGYEAE